MLGSPALTFPKPIAALLPMEKVLPTAATTSASRKKPRHPPPREGF